MLRSEQHRRVAIARFERLPTQRSPSGDRGLAAQSGMEVGGHFSYPKTGNTASGVAMTFAALATKQSFD